MPPSHERDQQKSKDNKMDEAMRDAPLGATVTKFRKGWTAASCLNNRSEGSSMRRDGPGFM
jgi:hypothetical protein